MEATKMNVNEKAAQLYQDFKANYNHIGFDKKSFIRRLKALSKQVDRENENHTNAILYIDVISLRMGIELS
jgi:uncharacterized protein (UPF0335 family)